MEDVFIIVRWVREGLFRFTSSCTGVLFMESQTPDTQPSQLKKKELFNVKEAHNTRFLMPYVSTPVFSSRTALMIPRRQLGWYHI